MDNKLFLRIDGNHRLSAASYFKDSSIGTLICPFCLILLPPGHGSTKFEKTIFYNINSKSVPLLKEEIHRIVLDNYDFSDEELMNHNDFGKRYVDIRYFLKSFNPNNYLNLKEILVGERVNKYRTVLIELYSLIPEITRKKAVASLEVSINRALKAVDSEYGQNSNLKNGDIGLLVACLYFSIKFKKFEFDWFIKWIDNNRIFELREINARELIQIFEKIIETRDKTIFVSMQFGHTATKNHYDLIESIIEDINREKNANIKLQPLKIEDYKIGDSYLIPDKILEKIEESSLLIADLTFNNQNVYHEIGYKVAYNKAKGNEKFGLIMILNKSITPIADVKFNIKHHKILPFNDTNEIKKELKEEIYNYYFKD